MGKRIDAILLIDHTVFVIEFKVGERTFARHDIDQVWDYALDLKNFHESSHAQRIAPVLVVTGIGGKKLDGYLAAHLDGVLQPSLSSVDRLPEVIADILGSTVRETIEADAWDQGRYRPTPTIVEAASALYRGHSVSDISRNDAGAVNLGTAVEPARCPISSTLARA